MPCVAGGKKPGIIVNLWRLLLVYRLCDETMASDSLEAIMTAALWRHSRTGLAYESGYGFGTLSLPRFALRL